MKNLLTISFIFLLSVAIYGQEITLKSFVFGQIVEIIPQPLEDKADFQIVDISIDGKVIKKFSTGGVLFPQIIGTFTNSEAEYILYRTYTGNGMCGGGDLYVIKFNSDSNGDKLKSVDTSPVLTACLREFPVFSVTYNRTAQPVLTISGFSINLDYLNKWNKNKTNARTKR